MGRCISSENNVESKELMKLTRGVDGYLNHLHWTKRVNELGPRLNLDSSMAD